MYYITFAYVYFLSSVVNHILLDTEVYVVCSYSLYTLLTYFTSVPCILGNIFSCYEFPFMEIVLI